MNARGVDWVFIDQAFSKFSPSSLLALLAAAMDSPGCGHRLPSLEVLWVRALRRPTAGQLESAAQDLDPLLASARLAYPKLTQQEDWWPPDPRLVVRHASGGRRLRVHPGLQGNPIAALRSVEDVALAIDVEVDRRHGFRLSDLIEATLRYSDWRLEELESVWPATRLERDVAMFEEVQVDSASAEHLEGDDDENSRETDEDPGAIIRRRALRVANAPVSLTDAEVNLARRLLGVESSWLSECIDPERAARAWRWATVAASDVHYEIDSPLPISGALAAKIGDQDVAFPASLALPFLSRAVFDLARELAGNRECLRRMREVATARVITALGEEIEGMLPVVWSPGTRHAYVIGSAVGLDEAQVQKDIRRQVRLLRAIGSNPGRIAKRMSGFDPTGSTFPILILGAHLGFRDELNAPIPRFHVQELIDISQDCWQHRHDGGQALLWQFVEDLHDSVGVVQVLSHDMDDLWRLFLKLGSLNPANVPEATVYPDPHPRPSRWEIAAEWEPYEDLLYRCGLAPRWKMHNTAFNAEEHVASGWVENWIVTASKDPDLVTAAKFDRDQEPLLDAGLSIGLADGIRLTMQNFDLWRHLSKPNGVVPLIRIEFDQSREVRIGFQTEGNRIALAPSLGWIQYLTQDPEKAHEAVGETVAECFARLGYLAAQARQGFLADWKSAPPIAYLVRRRERLRRPPQGRLNLPRTIATKADAEGRLATYVRKRKFEPAIYIDEYAFREMNEIVEPAIEEAFTDLMAGWSREALMPLANQLNLVHAERYRRETEVQYAMSRPWRARWRKDALTEEDPAALTRPVEILVELFLKSSTPGTVVPDQFDIARAVDLVDKALRIQLAVSAARNQLAGLMIGVEESGLVNAFPRPSMYGLKAPKLAVDLEAYIEARRGFGLRDRAPGDDFDIEEYTGSESPGVKPFTPIEQLRVPKRMLIADGFLKDQFGYGLNALSAVMGTAVNWKDPDEDVRIVGKADLAEQAIEWSKVPADEILAAVKGLTLTSDALRKDRFEYWELESRSYRLAIRPLVEVSAHEILLIPWLIHRCQDVFVIYMSDGRIPWPPMELTENVRNAFNRYRQLMNDELERDVEDIAQKLGLVTKARIIAKKAAAIGLLIEGEIDTLIADQKRKRLWVCEVKDLQAGTSYSGIATGLRKFLGPKGYIQKLIDRHQEISADVAGALRLLKVDAEPTGWDVRRLMVTRRIEAAAFAYDRRVPFVVVSDLINELGWLG